MYIPSEVMWNTISLVNSIGKACSHKIIILDRDENK